MKRILFKGNFISLVSEKVLLPNGTGVILDKIIHPGAVLIVPFVSDDKIVLLRQYRPVIGKYLYEFPAGTLKPGEPLLECARRELLEETGYTAFALEKIGVIYPVPGYSTEKITIFKATGLAPGRRHAEPDEIITIRILSKSQLRSLLEKGAMNDAKTICALSMCGRLG